MSTEESSPRARPKRQSSSKQKKLDLLEKLRNGKKNKYDIGELQNVYEEVDEREYTKKVLARQDDDWIVDDGGCGYVEDGREIFDDDLDEESIRKSQNVSTGKKRARDLGPEKSKGNIRNLFANMPNKKKKKEVVVNLEDDDILGDIIGEIDSTAFTPSRKNTDNNTNKQISGKDYLKSLSENVKISKPISSPIMAPPIKNTPVKPIFDLKENSTSTPCLKIEKQDDTTKLVEVKEEPIDIDEIQEYSIDMFEDAFEEEEILCQEIKQELVSPPTEVVPVIKVAMKEEIGAEWDKSFDVDAEIAYVNVDKSKLPLIENENGQQVLKFFYWDAHEDMYTQPGTIFLFGKVYIESVSTYASCCIAVKNIDRRIFLLPREKRLNLQSNETFGDPLTLTDVYEEFNTIVADKYKIKQFKSRKTTKKYAFGDNSVPLESEYLEVRYPANFPSLPSDLNGETFSHVFGTRTSFLEILVLERGVKGPGWLEITNPEPVLAPFTWCKIEASCSKPTCVNVLKPSGLPDIPPLVVVTLHPQAVYNAKTKQSEIVAVACLVSTPYPVDKAPPEKLFNQHFCVYSKPSDTTWPFDLKEALSKFKKTTLEKMESERALLNMLLTKLYRIDPDVIVGHDLSGYGIELILKRITLHKVPNWSRFGRLKRSVPPTMKYKSQLERIALTGRLLCDIKVSGKELLKARTFDLDSLCQIVLNYSENSRQDFTDEEFKSCYYSGENLVKVLWWLMTDASHILRIFKELNILPLALQITNIAGNVMSRTLMGGRSERNEFLLLHAFHNKGYLVPDKEFKKTNVKEDEDLDLGVMPTSKSSKKKPSYAGGLVLDPKVGFYDEFILLMDFNSLYPSIIQEYNICFTTIPPSTVLMNEDFNENYHRYFPEDSAEAGILPTEIRKLVESRKDVKKLLKSSSLSPELRAQYDIRQTALKLTANSMYGCLGFSNSRFCAKGLAALVTAKGREILLSTKRMVEGFCYEVIYGDTDSIMINTKTKDYEQVYQIGRKIKFEVNKCYKKVELDIDGVFKYMLLLKKKKYAAVTLTKGSNGKLIEKKEMKGLDIVRRDWSQLAAAAGKHILGEILSDKSIDDRIEGIHEYLEKVRSELENGQVPLSVMTVTKQLTKPPEEYNDPKNLPHVLVALRLNKTSSKHLKQGDTVSYIICKDGTSNSAAQRSYHADELIKSKDTLSIDTMYYLEQQIHPVISRLCDPIDGIDAVSIARCLGLDPNKYTRLISVQGECDEITDCALGLRNEERFKDCERFSFTCKNTSCNKQNTVESLRQKTERGIGSLFLEKCTNPECNVLPINYLPYIQNQLQLKIRQHVKKYYEGWLICEDSVCQHRTRIINPIFSKGYPECIKCNRSTMRREVSSLSLYNQLTYYQNVFDLKRDSIKIKPEDVVVAAYQKVYKQVEEVLKQNKYSTVDLGALFSQLFPK